MFFILFFLLIFSLNKNEEDCIDRERNSCAFVLLYKPRSVYRRALSPWGVCEFWYKNNILYCAKFRASLIIREWIYAVLMLQICSIENLPKYFAFCCVSNRSIVNGVKIQRPEILFVISKEMTLVYGCWQTPANVIANKWYSTKWFKTE